MSMLLLVYMAGAMVMGYLIIKGGKLLGNDATAQEKTFIFCLASISAILWPLAMIGMILDKGKDKT